MNALKFIVTLAILVCVVVWMFETEFLIFDILFMLCLIALQIIIPLIIIIAVLWAIKELFGW
jgi:F0F1-type ATP synthase assembly protein I